MSEVDKVRAAYLHDPSVSQEDYARLIEAADEADRAREAAAEKPDDEDTETVVVMVGNPADGVTLYGPFVPNTAECDEFCDSLHSTQEWWIVPVHPKEDA